MSLKSIISLLKTIDLFSTPISFKIDNSNVYHSLIGGIFTLIFFCFSIFYIIHSGINFIKRKDISFIYSRQIVESEPFINLTKVNFNIAFGLQYADSDDDVLVKLEKYFDFSFRIVEWIGERNITYIPLNYKKCLKSDFYNKIDFEFEVNRVGDLYCPIINETVNFTLNGYYVDNYFRYVEVKVLLSNYSMEHFNELEEIMMNNRLEMIIFFLDKAVNYENKTNPLPFHFGFSYDGLDSSYKKECNIYISCINFYNNENWFFDTPILTEDATFDQSKATFIYLGNRTHNKRDLGIYNIEASTNKFIFHRKYEKIPTFFANLTGIFSAIHLVFYIINEYINQYYISEFIIHKTMKYRGNKNINIEIILQKCNFQSIKLEKESENIDKTIKTNINHFIIKNNNNNKIKNNEQISQNNYDSIDSIKENKIENDLIFKQDKPCPVKNDKNLPNISINNEDIISKDTEKKITEKPEITEGNNTFLNESNKNNQMKLCQNVFSKMNIIEILYSIFCSCSSKKQRFKNKLFRQAADRINYYMDVRTYIERAYEHELLLNLLFNKDEYQLFKFLSKPTFKVGKEQLIIFQHPLIQSDIVWDFYNINKINNLLKSYNTIIINKSKTKFSTLLIDYMNEQIKFLK